MIKHSLFLALAALALLAISPPVAAGTRASGGDAGDTLCAAPDHPVVTQLTTTQATLSWGLTSYGSTPSGYDLVVTTADGTSVFNGRIPAGNSHTVTGLVAATTYNVLLTSDCQSTMHGTSATVSLTFTTPCPVRAGPYVEGFNNQALPQCTYSGGAATDATVRMGTYGYSLALTPSVAEPAYIVFPELSVSTDSLEVEFYIRKQAGATNPKFMAGLVSDQADIATTFEPFVSDSVTSTGWQLVHFNTVGSTYPVRSTSMVCVYVASGEVAAAYIDNVEIHHVPTCIRPEDLRVDDYTSTTATLGYTTARVAQLEAMILVGNDTTYQAVTGNGSTVTVTGLTPATDYRFRLRAVCGSDDASLWSRSETAVRTMCTAASTPYFAESFERMNPATGTPECWRQGWITKPEGNTLERPFGINNNPHSGVRGYHFAGQSAGTVGYLAGRAINVTTPGALDVSLWVRRDDAAAYAGEQIAVYVNTVPNSTEGGTLLGTVSRDYHSAPVEQTPGWQHYNFPINATGELYVVIVGTAMGGNNLCFDDVAVTDHVSCNRVTNVVADTASAARAASFSWTASGTETGYRVRCSLSRDGRAHSTLDTIVANPQIVIGGLDESAAYNVEGTVEAICAAGDTAEAQPFSLMIATLCDTLRTFPVTQGFEGLDRNTAPYCWLFGGKAYPNGNVDRSPFVSAYKPLTGEQCLVFPDQDYGKYSYLTSPLIDFGSDGRHYSVTFSMYRYGYLDWYEEEALEVYVGNSPDRCEENHRIAVMPRFAGSIPAETEENYFTYTYDIPDTLATGARYVMFVYQNYGEGGACIDNVRIDQGTTCRGLTASSECTDGREAKLIAADGTVASWQAAYGPVGAPIGSMTIAQSDSTALRLTGLQPRTTYEYYVRRVCGAGDTSIWSAAQSFTTTEIPQSIPFICDFENPAADSIWTTWPDDLNHFAIGSDPNGVYAGNRALYVENEGRYSFNYNYEGWQRKQTHALVMIHFDEGVYQCNLRWKCPGGDTHWSCGRIMLMPVSDDPLVSDNPTYSSIDTRGIALATGNETGNTAVCLANIAGDDRGWNNISESVDMRGRSGNYYLELYWLTSKNSGSNYPLAVDNIHFYEVTCVNPAVNPATLGSTTVTLSRGASSVGSWELYVDDNPFIPYDLKATDRGIHHAIDTAATVTLTGLVPNTRYFYTYRTICAVGDTSPWAEPVEIITACVPRTMPYTESFDSETAANCWSPLGTLGSSSSLSRATDRVYSGRGSLSVVQATAVSPELAGDSLALCQINGRAFATAAGTSFGIGVATDPNDPATYVELGSFTIAEASKWTEFTVSLSGLTDPDNSDYAGARYVALATATGTVYFDDLTIGRTPTCRKPAGAHLSAVTATSVDIAITDSSAVTAWAVDMNGTKRIITSATATISGLTPATTYAVSVAAICSPGDTSDYTIAGTVTTGCAPMPLPYYQGFESLSTGYAPGMISSLCWNELNMGQNTYSSMPYYNANTTSPAEGKLSLYMYGSRNAAGILILPEFETATGASVSLDVKGGTLTVGYITDAADAATFTALQSIGYSNNWATHTVSLAAMPAGARVALRLEAGNNAYCYVDKIEVNRASVCTPVERPTVSEITATTATVTFADTVSTHTAWQWVCAATGTSPDDASLAVTSISAITDIALTGLMPDADYTVYVRAIAGTDTSVWKSAIFHTLCAPFVVTLNSPFEDSFEDIISGDIVSGCYSQDGFDSYYYSSQVYLKGIDNYSSSAPWRELYARTGERAIKADGNANYIGLKRELSLTAGRIYEASVYTFTYYSNGFRIDLRLTTPTGDTITLASADIEPKTWVMNGQDHSYALCWQEVAGSFIPQQDGVYTLIIGAGSTATSGYVYFDDLSFAEVACPTLRTAPRVGTPTSTGVDVTVDLMGKPEAQIGWAHANASASADRILGTQLTTAATTTISGLTPGSAYVCYYRLICAAGDTSAWSPASESIATFATDCFAPQDFVAEAVTSHTARIAWRTAAAATTSLYELSYGTLIVATGTTTTARVDLAGLESAHTYTLRVRTLCSGTDTSAWASYGFTTGAAEVDAPFVCDFEDSDFNHQWGMQTTMGANGFVIGQAVNNGGQRSLYVSNNGADYQYSHGDAAANASMLIRFAPGRWFISYDWRSAGETDHDGGRLYLMPDTATDLQAGYAALPVGAINVQSTVMTGSNAWNSGRYIYNNTGSDTVTLRLVAAWVNDAQNGEQPPLAIDNIAVQPLTCDYPARVSASDFTLGGATMIVTRADAASPLQYAVSEDATPDESTVWTEISTIAERDTIVLAGLDAGTVYSFFVRHACDDQSFSPAIATRFVTLSPGSVTLPYVCGFEADEELSGWTMSHDYNTFVIGQADACTGSRSLYVSEDFTTAAYNGMIESYSYASQPIVFTRAGMVDYSFSWKGYGQYSDDYGRMFLAPADLEIPDRGAMDDITESRLPEGCIRLDDCYMSENRNSWRQVSGRFGIPGPGVYRIVVYWINDNWMGRNPGLLVDDIRMNYLSCQQLSSANYSIDWTGNTECDIRVFGNAEGASLKYQVSTSTIFADTVAYGTAGDDIDTCLIHLAGLTPGTNYHLRLISVCGEGEQSEPYETSFRTECDVISAYPWQEGFENMTPLNVGTTLANYCWSVYNSVGLNDSQNRFAAPWSYVGTSSTLNVAHDGQNSLCTYNGNIGTVPNTLYTALPAMSGLEGMWFEFWSSNLENNYYSLGGQADYGYLANPENVASFVRLGSVPCTAVWTKTCVQLTGMPATTRLCIRTVGNGRLFLDDFSVYEIAEGDTYTDTVCYNESYTAHGFNVIASDLAVGQNTLTRYEHGVVDTLITANVVRLAEISTVVYDTICGGTDYNVGQWNIVGATSDVYIDRIVGGSRSGCDSTVTLHLTVLPASHFAHDTICAGTQRVFGDTVLATSGLYVRSYQNQRGCTIVDSLQLVVLPDTIASAVTVCQYDMPYSWQGRSLTAAGVYHATVTGPRGCSQTLSLTLDVAQADSTVNLTICSGGQAQVADTILTTAGNYTLVRVNDYGCDITYHITVAVNAPARDSVADYACEGRPYSGYGLKGAILAADTTFEVWSRTADMCDSVTVVSIAFRPTQRTDVYDTIATGDSYEWNDQTYTQPGDYTVTLQDSWGCDSVVTLHLEVKDGVDNVSDNGRMRIVPNPAVAGGQTLVFTEQTGRIVRVEILNSFGATVDSREPQSTPISITAPAATGVYHVRVTSADGRVYVEKLIVK